MIPEKTPHPLFGFPGAKVQIRKGLTDHFRVDGVQGPVFHGRLHSTERFEVLADIAVFQPVFIRRHGLRGKIAFLVSVEHSFGSSRARGKRKIHTSDLKTGIQCKTRGISRCQDAVSE